MCLPALCGQAEEQPVQAPGQVPADGGGAAAERARSLHHRPGGDGGGVERPAVRGPGAALSVGVRWHGRGRCLTCPSLCPPCCPSVSH